MSTATDLRAKETTALQSLLDSKREELTTMVREKRVSERGDATAARKLRREIARIMTIINEQAEVKETA